MNTQDANCTRHDSPIKTTLLTTGEYTYCEACADEKIAQKMKALKAELTTKWYRLGESHADPSRTWLDMKELSA